MPRFLGISRVLTALLVGFAIGCNSTSPPVPPVKSTTATSAPAEPSASDIEEPKPSRTPRVPVKYESRPVNWDAETQGAKVVTASPEQLQVDGLEDRYPTQVVEVTAIVSSVDEDAMGPEFTSIRLNNEKDTQSTAFRVFEPQAFSRIAPGQTVTLQGMKFDVSPVVRFPFRVLRFGPNPSPIISSTQISEDFAKDPQLAHEKYSGQWLYVTGKVVGIRPDWDDNSLVTLDGNTAWPVELWLNKAADETKSVEAGQSVAMLVKYEPIAGLNLDEPKIELKGLPIRSEFPAPGVTYAADLPSRADRDAKAREQLQAAKAEVTTDAATLIRQFRDSEVQFRSDYSNKIVELSGIIQEFAAQKDGHHLIRLQGDDLLTFDVVTAVDEPWNSLQPGQSIKVRGRFPRAPHIPQIESAIVLTADAPGEPIRQVTAAELLAGCLNADDKFASDWKDKFVKVTGKIQAVTLTGVDPVIELEGPDGSRVQLELGWKEHARQMRLSNQSVGQTLTFLGRVNSADDDAKVVSLKQGWILKGAGATSR